MTEPFHFSPLVGRTHELQIIQRNIYRQRQTALIVTGPSGIGKTAIVDHFAKTVGGSGRFKRVWMQSLYRLSWTSALSEIRRRLERVPRNATIGEIEERFLSSCLDEPTLVILDNVDDGNVREVAGLLDRWQREISDSSIILTAQPQVAAHFSPAVNRLELGGIKTNAAILDIVSDLIEHFSESDLLDVSRLVSGNPQKLLFLSWMKPSGKENLRQVAENLQHDDEEFVLEDFLQNNELPGLFLLALGIHRSFTVTDRLLAFLWDNFGSGGADSYVRIRNLLIDKKVLLQENDQELRLHETVHLRLEKALLHRVTADRIPRFHQYFAEFYEQALREKLTTTNLTHFIHHSLAAKNSALAFRAVIDESAAVSLATRGSAVLVRQELAKLDNEESIREVSALDEVKLLLSLGGICNDLSDHRATLQYMARATEQLSGVDRESADSLQRRIWYYSAVSLSNLGQSDRCEQEYFKIVDSCSGPEDGLACISLGYLAHDIKYRDLALALDLGEISIDWARLHHPQRILAKNICNYAESLMIADKIDEAVDLFMQASRLAEEQDDIRELGRIETNLGYALCMQGSGEAAGHIAKGKQLSSSVGDRRRQTQATLFAGINYWRLGDQRNAKLMIRKSVELLRNLQDGRYFIPALCWNLQIEGSLPRKYPSLEQAPHNGEMTEALRYAQEHPEFRVYHDFWWRHLSNILV
jgi:tetratricopeptide (TPR) repeat protein